jgi:hypothetical protein
MNPPDEEPEILAVLPANGWAAIVGDDLVPLVAWVAMDTAKMCGVAVGGDAPCSSEAGSHDKERTRRRTLSRTLVVSSGREGDAPQRFWEGRGAGARSRTRPVGLPGATDHPSHRTA